MFSAVGTWGFLTLNPLPSASGLRPVISRVSYNNAGPMGSGRSVQWFVTPTYTAGLDLR